MSKIHSFVDFLGRQKYIVVIAIIVLVVGFVDENSLWNRHLRNQSITELKDEINAYKTKYDDDTRRLNELKSHSHVERLAREKYLMKRPTEDVFIIQHKPTQEELDAQSTDSMAFDIHRQ